MQWLVMAAKQGNTSVQFNLGCMYYRDEGVPENRNKAMAWLSKAAKGRHALALEAYKDTQDEQPSPDLSNKKQRGGCFVSCVDDTLSFVFVASMPVSNVTVSRTRHALMCHALDPFPRHSRFLLFPPLSFFSSSLPSYLLATSLFSRTFCFLPHPPVPYPPFYFSPQSTFLWLLLFPPLSPRSIISSCSSFVSKATTHSLAQKACRGHVDHPKRSSGTSPSDTPHLQEYPVYLYCCRSNHTAVESRDCPNRDPPRL